MNTINNSPNFRARTIISVSDNLLSKKEIKDLTKIGEKIGFNHDTINYGVRKINDNTIGIAHRSDFYINGNSLKTNKSQMFTLKDAKPFEVIKEQLKNLKSLYNNTISKIDN